MALVAEQLKPDTSTASTPTVPPPTWLGVRASALLAGDRRFEADVYLSSGYGIRIAIESRPAGWVRFGRVARAWMPGRLKGIQVGPAHGTPFLAATQVFDARPVAHKWLSLSQTAAAARRFVEPGTIL